MASAIVSAGVFVYFRSLKYAIISFISGIIIDLDHFIDYYASYGFTLKFKNIYYACLERKVAKVYVLLHSYELVIILWALIYLFSLSNFWIATAIGITQHMILDHLTNKVVVFGYFFIYRALKGFNKDSLFIANK